MHRLLVMSKLMFEPFFHKISANCDVFEFVLAVAVVFIPKQQATESAGRIMRRSTLHGWLRLLDVELHINEVCI